MQKQIYILWITLIIFLYPKKGLTWNKLQYFPGQEKKTKYLSTIHFFGRIHIMAELSFHSSAEKTLENTFHSYIKILRLGILGSILHPKLNYLIQIDNAYQNINKFVRFSPLHAWIEWSIIPQLLLFKIGRLSLIPQSREGKSWSKLLFSSLASSALMLENNALTGIIFSGHPMKQQFHYYIWFLNADHTILSQFDSSKKSFKLGGRFEYDFVQPWLHGQEWTKKRTNATLGFSISYSPWENLKQNQEKNWYYQKKGILRFSVDIGLSVDIFYIQAALSAIKGEFAQSNGTTKNIENGYGFNTDLALTLLNNSLVPAIRFEYLQGSSESFLFSHGNNRKEMALWFVINWLPAASHAFKLQPEFYIQLENQNFFQQGRPQHNQKQIRVRLSSVLNF